MYAQKKAQYIIDNGFPMIENFYSDSLADTPLALSAEKAHLVTKKGEHRDRLARTGRKGLEKSSREGQYRMDHPSGRIRDRLSVCGRSAHTDRHSKAAE